MKDKVGKPEQDVRIITGIGPVSFERSLKARHIRIIVTRDETVRCRVPRGIPLDRASKAVESRKSWIDNTIRRLRNRPEKPSLLASGEVSDIKAARHKIKTRLEHLAAKYAFSFNRISFRKQRTRWGSCSPGNDISLNLRLSLLPDHLLDYVLMHELAHTVIKNHGAEFWKLLDSFLGDAKELRKELRSYSL